MYAIPGNAAEKQGAFTNFLFLFYFYHLYVPLPSPTRNDKLPDCIRNIQGARCVPGLVLSIFFFSFLSPPPPTRPTAPAPAPAPATHDLLRHLLRYLHRITLYCTRRKNFRQRSRTRVASKVLAYAGMRPTSSFPLSRHTVIIDVVDI